MAARCPEDTRDTIVPVTAGMGAALGTARKALSARILPKAHSPAQVRGCRGSRASLGRAPAESAEQVCTRPWSLPLPGLGSCGW